MYFSEPLSLLQAAILLCPDSSKTKVRELIQQGRILVDGSPVTDLRELVTAGQKVTLAAKKWKIEGQLPIVYEDPFLIVVDKPTGLLSVASNFEKEKTAHALVKGHCKPKKVYVIHRLDFETSGLMVFAKEQKTYEALKEELASRRMKRIYYGVVEGVLTGGGTWQNRLIEDANYFVSVTSHPNEGELAITHYEVLEQSRRFSFVCFTLETGKKNQIRVQAAYAGYPLVGDSKYRSILNPSSLDPLKRLALHASELSFFHPHFKKLCKFSSPPPSQFRALCL